MWTMSWQSGKLLDLEWLVAALRKTFELKNKFVGPGQSAEASYLGRTIRWTQEGVSWTHDSKRFANLVSMYGLETSNVVQTPVVPEDFARAGGDCESELLEGAAARRFRAAAATVNYLSQDRPDLSVASCTLARAMSSPRAADEVRAKRVIRYLRAYPQAAIVYRFQQPTELVLLQTDSDWASCKSTRRSCSGGLLKIGQHLIHHWCRMQNQISLSSAESELYATNRGYCEMAGLTNLCREVRGNHWGTLRHQLDSSSCRSVVLRKGSGQLKHLEVRELWCQKFVKDRSVEVEKIPRAINAADALASPCNPGDLERHMTAMSLTFSGGHSV